MLPLFISIVVPLIVLGLIVWLIGLLPLDPKIMQVIRAVAIIIVVLWLLAVLFGWSPGLPVTHMGTLRGC